MPANPSLIVSLSPDGGLQIELPGSGGAARVVPLRQTSTVNPADTIRRILLSQAQSRTELGSDGAPTRQQLQHWERHSMFPDSRCPFCQFDLAVARGLSPKMVHRSSHENDARYQARDVGGGVTVRKIPAGVTAAGLAGAAKARASREAKAAPIDARNVELNF